MGVSVVRTVDEYGHGERHDCDGDEEIGDCQRHEEVVAIYVGSEAESRNYLVCSRCCRVDP